jgi:hypothetical protein
MPTPNNKLYLYEAIELRAEYDARIKTIKDCLPETRRNRNRLSFGRDDDSHLRPSAGFDVAKAREALRTIEFKRRKLNSAIQKANFGHSMAFEGDSVNLNEALELRKALNERIGELHTQVTSSAYERVIYKEGRDIVEENEVSYEESVAQLETARLSFRNLNREIRKAAYEVVVDFNEA